VNRAAEQLLDLQHADDEVERLAREVAATEASLAGDPELDRAQDEATRLADAHRQAELHVRSLEGELDALRARVKTLDRQLYGGSVRNPAELLTLQHELDALKAQVSEQEDVTLAAMEDADAIAGGHRDQDAVVAAIEAHRAGELGPMTERLGQLRQQHETAVAARDALVEQVPPKSLALYRRVASKHTPAVVRVVSGSCGGCHLPVGAHDVHEARFGEAVVQCANCDRILAP
jgi:predicted  nucleic acid-binding Zn-ribbon protein